tara:strand:+ start:6675 stop:6887 length:213 start_codon:yes stop_codon:yes gene_type:complete
MPDFKVKDNSFKLWKNKYKEDGDKKPDYTGNGMFDGSTKDVALWINKDKNGNRYLSGQLKDPKGKDESPF